MRKLILDVARDLLAEPTGRPPTLDELAANAGITSRQLRAYYTSVAAIEQDLARRPSASEET